MSFSTFEDILARDGVLVYKTRGVSMEPMLRQDRDLVVIKVPSSRLRKMDVALYKRGDAYVLHRVVGVEDDRYLIRGDNTYALETVADGDVIGVLEAFVRKGMQHEVTEAAYLCYARAWNAIYPARYCWNRGVWLAKVVARKLHITALAKRLLRRER